MSARLTNRIVGLAAGHNFLKDNEVNHMICLLKTYACAVKEKNSAQTLCHEIPKTLLDISCLDLKGRKSLTLTEEWLLGKLPVVALQNTKGSKSISLSNFPRSPPIRIAKGQRQLKLGSEENNNRLKDRRIKAGKDWIVHLPVSFNDKLIAGMFLDIDTKRAVPVFQKSYKSHLRCNPMDSSALKGFAWLNNTQYERFGRGFFYFTSLRCLATIKDVRKL